MTLQFDSWALEVYNGGWVDITADVRVDPHLQWNRGIMSNKQDARLGDVGMLSFTLKNDAGNIGRKAGYYSPGNSNCWVGWTTGLAVRLSFVYDGQRYYKYYGRIKPDGISVEPGIYGARTVSVICGDWMWLVSQHEVKSLTFASSKKIGDVVNLVNANMPIQPLATSIATGVETFPTIFDMVSPRTTAQAEYFKAVMSEWAYIYTKGDRTGGETLVVENQTTRTSATAQGVISVEGYVAGAVLNEDATYILNEDGSKLLLDLTQNAVFDAMGTTGMRVGYGRTQTNRVSSSAYPRKVDAAATTVLWTLQKSFKILNGQTIMGYKCAYKDPANLAVSISAVNDGTMTTSYSATANEDGSGANKTANLTVTPVYGTDATIYTLTASADLWVQTLNPTGKGVYTYNPITSVQDNDSSQAIHGIIPAYLDFKYQSDADKVYAFCGYIITKEAFPRQTVDAFPVIANMDGMRMFGFLQMEPGMKAHFSESLSGVNGDYFINGYSAEMLPGGIVIWTPVLKDDPGYYLFWKLDQGQLDTSTGIFNTTLG